MSIRKTALAMACAIGLMGCGGGGGGSSGSSGAEITGAGATFPQPLYVRWAEQNAAQGGTPLNYQALGSGAGQNQIINRTVDFGATDAPVDAEKLAQNNLLQFPTVIGAVVLSVNVPGVDGSTLMLDGPTVADIYLGAVSRWNDARVKALNPGVTLPDVAIAPVYRADASGTTSIFTNYLSTVAPQFQSGVGAGTSVAWKTGIGAPGNAGVAGAIQNTRGAIGYVEYAYAVENGMPMPKLKNRDGVYVAPTAESFAAAASTADWDAAANMAPNLIDAPGPDAWPITSATYILVPTNPSDPARALKVLQFFDWAFKDGDAVAGEMHYVSLPEAVEEKARARWCAIKSADSAVWPGCA